MLPVNPLPEVNDISNPAGGVTTISAVKLLPETVKLCSAEAVPLHVVNNESEPITLIVGGGAREVKTVAPPCRKKLEKLVSPVKSRNLSPLSEPKPVGETNAERLVTN